MNFKILFAACIVFTFSNFSTNKGKEPEQVGKRVFEILKNISSSSKDDYISNFISIEEIRELLKKEEVSKDTDTSDLMHSITKENIVRSLEKDYNRIKDKGSKLGIRWNEIQYLHFFSESEEEAGIKVCEGELYFKCNDTYFRIEIASIFNGTEYRLVTIKGLREQP
jgi:hypothetical protein